MNDHACDLLKAAGKLDQVSPPEGSESSVTCPGQSSSGAATTGTGTSTGTGNGTTTDTASASSSSGAGDAGTVGGDKLAQSTTPLNGTASMAQEKLSVQPPKKTLKIECTLPDGDLTASESVQCTIDSGASSGECGGAGAAVRENVALEMHALEVEQLTFIGEA
ncbi:uncharacterized protein KY384_002290 [Bacidia gigantensis]|uniref:uncharacterized protein n=1 Tax=Bacidia gigantensis TaxID=2732470 RepID=UPI001D0399D8|nr:uncharacterized protein KY384_002290 [Bacidia gigantensis]KAG8533504.1 hypothetical protein KY384_002290 [Bacidia gigantensis]